MNNKRIILLISLTATSIVGVLYFALLPLVSVSATASDTGSLPAAAISVQPSSPVGPGEVKITLVTSQPVMVNPELLILVESDESITPISLSGKVPGTTFRGVLEVDETIAEGDAQFLLMTASLIDRDGRTGENITAGQSLRIDKTPPSAPQNLTANFQLN